MMGRDDINQLPVVSNGHLAGIFSRGHVVRFLQAHAQLHSH
jgi:CBS domain-containing protein